MNAEPSEQLIPINRIRPPEWNSRTTVDLAALKVLGETIKSKGQLQAIKVEQLVTNPNEDLEYILVWGSRRLAAMAQAGFKDIRARVFPPSSKTSRMLENALENVQRQDLTTYELARMSAALREEKLSLEECAEATGLSKSYISNLVVCHASLSGDILADWQASHEAATVSYLRELAKTKDHKEQLAIWQAHKASFEAAMEDLYDDEEDEDEEDDKDDDGPRKVKSFTVKADRYNQLLRALKATKAPAIALNVAQYLVGKIDRIKGLIEPPPEEKPLATKPKQKDKE